MTEPANPGEPGVRAERPRTILETDEDVRQAILLGMNGRPPGESVEPRKSAAATPPSGRPSSPFRPTLRPPTPILVVCDDGRSDGEIIRIRDPRFVIGRTEGDLRFPLDGRMSARHVEITHQFVGGLHRWVVTDLQSTHGMFVRVSKTHLADQAEFLVGNGRYRFDANRDQTDATTDHVAGDARPSATRGWDEGPAPVRAPALTELFGREIGNRVVLIKSEYWIGSDPACLICRPDDPFCEPRHVRLHQRSQGDWHAEHNRTENGLWLRMAQITAPSLIHFQIGEQRFKLRVS